MSLEDCPLCHSTRAEVLVEFPPRRMLRCRDCRLGYLSPRLSAEEMLEHYRTGDYYESSEGSGYSSYLAQERSLRLTFRLLIGKLARKGYTGGRLLEIGCGYGYFLTEARAHFSHLTGTDYSPGALEQARKTGATVYLGGLESVPSEETFDAAVMLQVLEHLYDPLDFLNRLRERLRPRGSLAVAVPNLASPLRLLLGRRWPSYKIPEHVAYYEQSTLKRTLEQAGFKNVQNVFYPEFFPLGLLAEKFKLRLPGGLARQILWVPTTSVACVGQA